MREIRSSGSVRGGDGDIPAYSAIGEGHGAADARRRGQLLVDGISIDLEDAVEALEQSGGVLAAAAGGVGIGHGRWITSPPWPIIAGDGPQESGLGLAAPGIKHRTARLIAEQLRRRLETSEEMIVQGLQLRRCRTDP